MFFQEFANIPQTPNQQFVKEFFPFGILWYFRVLLAI